MGRWVPRAHSVVLEKQNREIQAVSSRDHLVSSPSLSSVCLVILFFKICMLDPFPLPEILSSLAFQILHSPVFFSSTSPAMCYVSSATQSCFAWPSDAGFPVLCSRDNIPESCHHSGSFNYVLRTPKLVSGLQHFLLSFTYVPLQTSCLLGYLASEMSDIVTVHLSTWRSLSPCPPHPPATLTSTVAPLSCSGHRPPYTSSSLPPKQLTHATLLCSFLSRYPVPSRARPSL